MSLLGRESTLSVRGSLADRILVAPDSFQNKTHTNYWAVLKNIAVHAAQLCCLHMKLKVDKSMIKPFLLILPGDGISLEIMVEMRKIIHWFAVNKGLEFDISEDMIGGVAYDKYGTPCNDTTLSTAQEVDAVLLGAVGGPNTMIWILA